MPGNQITWWTLRIFFIFSARGEGRESPRRREGEGVVFFENPRRGGSPAWGGAEGPGGCLQRIGEFGGGGLNFFFGAEMSTKINIVCG